MSTTVCMGKPTLILWLTPAEAEESALCDDQALFAASCACTDLESIRGRLERENSELRIRVCRGLFLSRIIPTPQA